MPGARPHLSGARPDTLSQPHEAAKPKLFGWLAKQSGRNAASKDRAYDFRIMRPTRSNCAHCRSSCKEEGMEGTLGAGATSLASGLMKAKRKQWWLKASSTEVDQSLGLEPTISSLGGGASQGRTFLSNPQGVLEHNLVMRSVLSIAP